MGNCATVSVRAASVAPDLDTFGCNKTIGETWCAATQKCQQEWIDPCNPIEPVGGGTVVYTDTTPTPVTPSNGGWEEPQNQMLLIAAIAIVGGCIIHGVITEL